MTSAEVHLIRSLELLDQLLELPPAAREARLAEAPRELAAQVRRLLVADATHDPLLDGQGPALIADLLAQELAADRSEQTSVKPQALHDPERVGPYRVLTRRGAGASGVVYEAEQESPRRRVAIKIVRPRAEGEAARAAFLQEAQALATLSHPVIPYVIEASPWERGVYIAMELVDGLGFREALASKSKAQVLELFARLCDGVHHVHQGGWAHRDLKPANVRMTADGRPKLLDFGLALSLGEHGRPGGTLDYMSPEQAAGARGDHRSDLYSLGVMLHEALTGRVPLSCRGLALVEAAQRKRRRVDLQALEPQLRAVLGRCLQRRPEARYPSAAALAADLRRAAVDLPVVGGPLRASARASLFVRRHRRALTWLLVVAATVAFVLVARAGVERWQQQRREAAALKSARSLRASTRALEEQGAEDRAQVVFETWARLPEHQGTRALTRAWLEHQGLFDAVHPLGGREAIAQAYVSAPDDLARVEVLSALAERAYRDGRFATMTRALRALEEFGGVGAPELWARALAGARRLDEAADRLPDDSVGPVLRALARVSPTDVPATSATPALGGRLWLNDWVSKKVRLVEARPQLPVVTEWALPNTLGHMPWGLASEPGLLLQIDDPVTRSARLVRASADRAEVEVLRAALPGPVHHVVEADLDGDGEPGLFWGTGAYARDIFTVDRETGALSRPIAPEDRAGSDVYGLVAGDFDGDGQRELAASFSDWLAYDVRVFEGDERALRVRARVQEHGRLAALPHPDGGDALAVSRQFGEDPGLSLYRLEGDALVRYAFLRRPAALGGDDESLMTGDFDGDGRWDLALMSRRSSRVLTWLIRQVSPGRLDGILVPDTTLIFAQDLDGDGDTELATTTRVDGSITIHGTGAGALEPLTAAVDERSHVADLKLPDVDADLEAITRRPMELARLGLVDLAAELIASGAASEPDTSARARLHLLAARLEAADDRPFRALERARHALRLYPETPGLRAAALGWAIAVQDFQAARDLIKEDEDAVDAHVRARVEAAAAKRVEVDFRDPSWRFNVPGAFRLGRRGLDFDVCSYETTSRWSPLIARAVDLPAGHLGFDVELTLTRAEPGSDLRIGFADAETTLAMAMLRIVTIAGGGKRWMQAWCHGELSPEGEHRKEIPPLPGRAQRIRARVSVEGGETVCAIDVDGEQWVRSRGPTLAPLPRQVRWVMGTDPDRTVPTAAVRGTLNAVTLHGVDLVDDVDGSRASAASWVIDGRVEATLLPLTAQTAELHLAAGRRDAVAAWLRAQEDPLAVAAPIRRDPLRWLPLLDEAAPEKAEAMFTAAWLGALPSDPSDPEWLRLDTRRIEELTIADEASMWLVSRYVSVLRRSGQARRALALARRCVVADPRAAECWATLAALDPARSAEACAAALDAVGAARFTQLRRLEPELDAVCPR